MCSSILLPLCFSIPSSVRQESEDVSEEIEVEVPKTNKKVTKYVLILIHSIFYSPAYRKVPVSEDEEVEVAKKRGKAKPYVLFHLLPVMSFNSFQCTSRVGRRVGGDRG